MSALAEVEKGIEIREMRKVTLKLVMASTAVIFTIILLLIVHVLLLDQLYQYDSPRHTLTVLKVSRTYSLKTQESTSPITPVTLEPQQVLELAVVAELMLEAANADNSSEFNLSSAPSVRKAMAPCGKDLSCGKNAVCKVFPNRTSGICACKEGAIMNENRECDPGHLQKCPTGTCASGLNCINGACHCPGFGQYYPETNSCDKLVGSVCEVDDSPYAESSCTDNAYCKVKYNYEAYDVYNSKPEGVCTCLHGYEETAEHLCSEATAGQAAAQL